MATPIPAFVSQYVPGSADTLLVTTGATQTLGSTIWYYLVSNRTTASNGRSLLYAVKLLLEASLAATTWTVQLSATSPYKVTLSHNNGASRTITWSSPLQAALGFASATSVVATATTVTADYPSPLWWSPDMPISMTGPSQFDPAVSYGVPSSAGTVTRAPDGTCAVVSNGVQWSAEFIFNGVEYYYKTRAQSGRTNLDFETWWSNGPRRGRRFLMWRERANATGSNAPSGGSASPYNYVQYSPQGDLQGRLLVTPTTPNNVNHHDIKIPCFVTENGDAILSV